MAHASAAAVCVPGGCLQLMIVDARPALSVRFRAIRDVPDTGRQATAPVPAN
jgi:hypothetical protein